MKSVENFLLIFDSFYIQPNIFIIFDLSKMDLNAFRVLWILFLKDLLFFHHCIQTILKKEHKTQEKYINNTATYGFNFGIPQNMCDQYLSVHTIF